jgi:ribA/ribD-fused uncharacterized protein
MEERQVILLSLFFVVIVILFIAWIATRKKSTNENNTTSLGKWSACTKEMSKSQTLINGFCREHAFLSNFYPMSVTRNGKTYLSAEAAYQAAKFDDNPTVQNKFLNASADQSKKMAESNRYDAAQFSKRRLDVMREILLEKFKNPSMREQLLQTGDATLVEYNWWGDQFWGRTKNGGENQLGRLLMTIRKEINESK